MLQRCRPRVFQAAVRHTSSTSARAASPQRPGAAVRYPTPICPPRPPSSCHASGPHTRRPLKGDWWRDAGLSSDSADELEKAAKGGGQRRARGHGRDRGQGSRRSAAANGSMDESRSSSASDAISSSSSDDSDDSDFDASDEAGSDGSPVGKRVVKAEGSAGRSVSASPVAGGGRSRSVGRSQGMFKQDRGGMKLAAAGSGSGDSNASSNSGSEVMEESESVGGLGVYGELAGELAALRSGRAASATPPSECLGPWERAAVACKANLGCCLVLAWLPLIACRTPACLPPPSPSPRSRRQHRSAARARARDAAAPGIRNGAAAQP
jgi:hypothetical protein